MHLRGGDQRRKYLIATRDGFCLAAPLAVSMGYDVAEDLTEGFRL
jgi:hypothetical protein